MEDLFRKLNRSTDAVRLSDDERSAMRARLAELTVAMPATRPEPKKARGGWRALFAAPAPAGRRFAALPVFALVLAVVFTGGGAYAAEAALPGDLLYPVKVHVSEEVRAAFTPSAEAKAEWEAERASRRLEEAERLAARGTLDTEARADIEAKFKAHADKTKERVAELEEKGNVTAAAHVSSALEGKLRAHGRILSSIALAMNGEVDALAAAVEGEGDETEEVRVRTETRVGEADDEGRRRAAEGRADSSERKITEVRAFIAKWSTRVGTETAADAAAAIEAAAETHAEGEARLEADEYAAAFTLFQKAHREAQEAKLLMIASFDLRFGAAADDDGRGERRGHGNDDTAEGDEDDDDATADDRDDSDEDGDADVADEEADDDDHDTANAAATDVDDDEADDENGQDRDDEDGDDDRTLRARTDLRLDGPTVRFRNFFRR